MNDSFWYFLDRFGTHFFLCNLFIGLFVGLLAGFKRLFQTYLSSGARYRLWFFFLALLPLPFLPRELFALLKKIPYGSFSQAAQTGLASRETSQNSGTFVSAFNELNDFAVSVRSSVPSLFPVLFSILWGIGMLVMLLITVRSVLHLRALKHSALPIEDPELVHLYLCCCQEIHFTKKVPLYRTNSLTSPAATGVWKPCIYLPDTVIADSAIEELRFILLHELQHIKQKDGIIICLTALASIFYWCNPAVHYALREIRFCRELACDAAVLHCLKSSEYRTYGITLLNFAEKSSLRHTAMTAGIYSGKHQMKQRILNIAAFHRQTKRQKLQSLLCCLTAAFLFFGFLPVFAFAGMEQDTYKLPEEIQNISFLNLSDIFDDYDGSFVLYDTKDDSWKIYQPQLAKTRIAPNSTYKIYSALLGLETGMITPENSLRSWDKTPCPFPEWETDQTLATAMKNSVNWYFHSLDSQLGRERIQSFLQKIHYGNQKMSSDLSLYWTDASLKISPIEQVLLLKSFHNNDFSFAPKHIAAVQDAIRISSSPDAVLYGKTGTGRIDGQDVNGWFIGYVEMPDRTCYFATNIQGNSNTTGQKASEITASLLSKFHIYPQDGQQ